MITKELIAGGTVWQITGPGFYATYKGNQSTGLPYLTRLGYVQNVQFPASQAEGVIVSDVPTISAYTGIDITNSPQRELELFIRALYVLGVEFDTSPATFSLHEDMQGLGVLNVYPPALNFYSSIAVFDFMAMTGAVLYPFNRLVAGDITTRPTVREAEQGNKETMFQVIRKLGAWGYLINVFSEYGISKQELSDCLKEWLPNQADRASFMYSYGIPHLRTKGFRILSNSEITEIIT